MAELESVKVRVPKDQRAGLLRLLSLPDDQIEELRRALQSATPTLDSSGIVAQLQQIVSVPVAELAEIVRVLFSLALTRYRFGIETEQLLTEVAQAAELDNLLTGLAGGSDRLIQRLNSLLSVEHVIGVSAKAALVLTRQKHVFVSANISTDIRTVFIDTSSVTPTAGMVIHNLEITSHTDNEHTSHYVAMDSSELRTLSAVIERALQKEVALRQIIQSAGLAFIDATVHE
jgi:hypothetical protein